MPPAAVPMPDGSMPTLIYCRPTNYDHALSVAAQERGAVRNGAKFRAEDDVERADRVIVLDDLPAVAGAYRARGVDVEERAAPVLPAAPNDVPAPREVIHEGAEQGAPKMYRVEQSGQWHKLIGPDGEQVGRSQRTEALAWALLDG